MEEHQLQRLLGALEAVRLEVRFVALALTLLLGFALISSGLIVHALVQLK